MIKTLGENVTYTFTEKELKNRDKAFSKKWSKYYEAKLQRILKKIKGDKK